jgi:predicted tellurium resistance membrane protein TerC
VWKATTEIHHSMDIKTEEEKTLASTVSLSMTAAIAQILMLDLVFSIDSIITAVGMTEHLPIMIIAVVAAVVVMMVAADPLAKFINDNPTVVMLALGFLIMIGMTLIAEGFGAHVPKGYVYAAMTFSAVIEGLNMLARRAKRRKAAARA